MFLTTFLHYGKDHYAEKSSKTQSQILWKNQHFFRQINVFTIEVSKDFTDFLIVNDFMEFTSM